MEKIKIGMIGLDTSHVSAFTKLLHDESQQFYVPGGEIVVAFPGGSADFDLSCSRVEGFTEELRTQYNVRIVNSMEEVAEQCDAIMLESVDGRVHSEQFRKIAPYQKPVFIDKPFAVSVEDAVAIIETSKEYGTPIMSSSALRYAEGLKAVLPTSGDGRLVAGFDAFGPMEFAPPLPEYFWYGIHSVEMLFTAMGTGCKRVSTRSTENYDMIIGEWSDGRVGTVRGNRTGNGTFGATIHYADSSQLVDLYAAPKPYYASMLEEVMTFFQTKKSPIDIEETLEIVRFIEAANKSRLTQTSITLEG